MPRGPRYALSVFHPWTLDAARSESDGSAGSGGALALDGVLLALLAAPPLHPARVPLALELLNDVLDHELAWPRAHLATLTPVRNYRLRKLVFHPWLRSLRYAVRENSNERTFDPNIFLCPTAGPACAGTQ